MNHPDYTVFEGTHLLFKGSLNEAVMKVKKRLSSVKTGDFMIFCDSTGKTMDFNFQGSESDVLKRLEVFTAAAEDSRLVAQQGGSLGPGRPKLGVISREVSLLPRHWEWLASQAGGASATLRKLVESAKKSEGDGISVKQVQERTYRFMMVMAGDLPQYEEALRALYRRDKKNFSGKIKGWPKDIRAHALFLASPAFATKGA